MSIILNRKLPPLFQCKYNCDRREIFVSHSNIFIERGKSFSGKAHFTTMLSVTKGNLITELC